MSITSSPQVFKMTLVDWMSEQASEWVIEWAKLVINFLHNISASSGRGRVYGAPTNLV